MRWTRTQLESEVLHGAWGVNSEAAIGDALLRGALAHEALLLDSSTHFLT